MPNGLRGVLGDLSGAFAEQARQKIQQRQALEQLLLPIIIKQRIEQQNPMQQQQQELLRQFLGQQQPTQPTGAQPTAGVVQPQAGIQPQLGRSELGQFIPVPSISPTGGIGVRFQESPQAKEARQVRLLEKRTGIVEERNKGKAVRKLQKELEDTTGQIKIIQQDVDELFKTYNKISPRLRGPIQGRTLGPVFGRFLQASPAATEYEDARQFFLSNISRKLGGERGVLTDRDIARVDTLFPQLRDSDVVAKGKISRIKDFIQRRINEHEQRIKGQIQRVQTKGSLTPITEQDLGVNIQLDTQINDLLDQLGAE